MNNKTFTKTYASTTAPNPKMNILWMDLTADPYGSVLKYWNGSTWKEADTNLDSPAFTGAPTINGNEISTVPDNGTNYIMVYGTGTPTENAAELQAAYNAAKNMPRYLGNINDITDPIYVGQTWLFTEDGEPDKYYVATLVVDGEVQDTIEISAIQAKSVRTTLIVAPGDYTSEDYFNVDAEFINIVSLTGNLDIKMFGINITANNTYLKGIDVGIRRFNINLQTLGDVNIENCIGDFNYSTFGDTNINYKNCSGNFDTIDNYSVNPINHENCIGIFYIGSVNPNLNCKFCTSLPSYNFGSDADGMHGYFDNCIADTFNVSDECYFYNCKIRIGSWVDINDTLIKILNCINADGSIYSNVIANGVNNTQLSALSTWVHPTLGIVAYATNLEAYVAYGDAGWLYVNTTTNVLMQSIVETE